MNGHDPIEDEELRRIVEAARSEYHDPPEAPREEMWQGIAWRLQEPPRRRWRPGPVWSGLAAAGVVLTIGVGLGRWSMSGPAAVAESGVAESAVAEAPQPAGGQSGLQAGARDESLRFAAYRHLSETGAFLERMDSASADGALGDWGRRLLTDTRLLLDSSLADDADLRVLLEDLELILAQVVRLTGDRPEAAERLEREQLDRGLRDQQLLPRIRRMVPPVLGAD